MVALSSAGVGDSPAESLPPLPRAFGSYLLFDRIGRGGMAEVYLARVRDGLGGLRRVVIKEVLPELSQDATFARMLIAEAKLAARLNHRNIVQVTDLGRESDRLFIAMEYVEGCDLNQLLRQLSKRRLPLPPEFAMLIVREVLQALDYAHRAQDEHGALLGIVHRDVSPSNVLISFEGEVALCDFGIARARDAEVLLRSGPSEDFDESRVQRVRVAGKSAYMAPEQARGDYVDARSDLFAAGILLWELCAGRRMYKGTDEQMLAMARAGQAPELPARGLKAQHELQAILSRALAFDPAERYQSGAQMAQALDGYALGNGLMASELRFGAYLSEQFAEEIVALRRARERAAEAALHAESVPVTHVEPVTQSSDRPAAAAGDSAVARASAPSPAAVTVTEEPSSAFLWPLLSIAFVLAAAAAAYWLLFS